MANSDLKSEARSAGVSLWRIAKRLGINDGNFSRRLRTELSTDEKEHIRSLIIELKEGGKNE